VRSRSTGRRHGPYCSSPRAAAERRGRLHTQRTAGGQRRGRRRRPRGRVVTGTVVHTALTGHSGPVWGTAFRPDGVLATGSRDGTTQLRDARSGNYSASRSAAHEEALTTLRTGRAGTTPHPVPANHVELSTSGRRSHQAPSFTEPDMYKMCMRPVVDLAPVVAPGQQTGPSTCVDGPVSGRADRI
jgi:hypothetical protein